MRRALASFALGLAALSSFAQYPGAQPPPVKLQRGFDAIKVEDAQAILDYLAGPETQGRGTGQPGFQKAADFMAQQFKAAGLKPMGDNGTYFQFATFYRPTVSAIAMTAADGTTLDEDAVSLLPLGRDIDVSGEVVVVRSDGQLLLTDDQVESLRDKIVIALVPEGRTPVGRQLARSDAKAILTAVDRTQPVVPRASMQKPTPSSTARAIGQIARYAVSKLSPTIGTFMAQADGGTTLLSAKGEFRLSAKGEMEAVKVPNVVGLVEGSDPKLRNEVVGVGAHLDHLGILPDGTVYPGADDDGSGSTAVALITKAVAANAVKPKRSVLFMTFFGEEMGLLGSKFLTDHPPVPLDRMVAELQMDMVGRDSDGEQNGDANRVDRREENVDTIRLVGSKRISTTLDSDIQAMNRYVGFKFKYDAEDVYTRSDHYNFAAKGVPIAFLFDGFHPDYHQPTDTVDKIDWDKLTNAARLYYLTLMKVANDDAAPKKDVH